MRIGDEKQSEALKSKIARYDKEKAAISEKAKDDKMGLSVSLFQIAIAIGSICLAIRKKSSWFISLSITTAATVQMIYAWLMP